MHASSMGKPLGRASVHAWEHVINVRFDRTILLKTTWLHKLSVSKDLRLLVDFCDLPTSKPLHISACLMLLGPSFTWRSRVYLATRNANPWSCISKKTSQRLACFYVTSVFTNQLPTIDWHGGVENSWASLWRACKQNQFSTTQKCWTRPDLFSNDIQCTKGHDI